MANKCLMCGCRMLNDVQCSNKKCICNKLPDELQKEYDKQAAEAAKADASEK